MSQDTRKDKRAKVVSLNVRYKSATVDEFIENHSHDVSKGGIFVKTPTPFPPGTLLKFEIRLAGDKSVIAGVGRVVWKREPTQAGAERPAGMGVKFIKIDDPSRALIDKLTSEKPQAGSAYDSELPQDEEEVAGHPSTLRGIPAAASVTSAPPAVAHPVSVPPAKPSGSQLPVPPAGKLPPMTKLPSIGTPAPPAPAPPPTSSAKAVAKVALVAGPTGTGALKGPPPPAVTARAQPAVTAAALAASTAPSDKLLEKAAPASDNGPPPAPTSSEAPKPNAPPRPLIPPPRKATMMGMGSLPSAAPPALADAPKETPAPPKAAEPMFPRLDPASEPGQVSEPTVMKQAAELLEEALREAGGSMDEIGQNPLFAKPGPGGIASGLTPEPGPPPSSSYGQSGNTIVMGGTPSPSSVSPSAPPPSASTSPSAPPPSVSSGAPGVSSVRQSSPSYAPPASQAQPLAASLDQPKKKAGGAGIALGLVAVLAVAGGGVFAWKTGVFGASSGGTPTASPPPTTPTPTATPTVSAPPPAMLADAGTAAMLADAGAAAGATRDAGAMIAEKDAGKAVAEKPERPKPPVKPWKPPPPKPPVGEPTGDPPADTPKDPAPTDVPKDPPKDPAPAPAPAPDPN